LRVLIVSEDGQPMGILPLVVASERTRLGQLRVLTYPLEEWGTFYGPLGAAPEATLAAGLSHIRDTRRDWHVLDLRWVRAESAGPGRTQQALKQAGFAAHSKVWDHVPLVALDGSWNDYWASRGGWRRKVRHSERHLAAAGAVRYVRYRPAGAAHGDADPGWTWYEHCEAIATRSWQASVKQGNTLSHVSVRGFLREVHAAAAQAAAADINLLMINDQPVAFMYGYVRQGSVFVLRTGYDQGEQFAGAGTVLLARLIQDSFERGDSLINMGAGSLDWKRYWQTSVDTTYRYTYFAPLALKAQALRCKRAAGAWLRGRLRLPEPDHKGH
jgi:CelD/BcsL family acetyltransferase involved in cellulose biosynthesis